MWKNGEWTEVRSSPVKMNGVTIDFPDGVRVSISPLL